MKERFAIFGELRISTRRLKIVQVRLRAYRAVRGWENTSALLIQQVCTQNIR